MHLDTADAAARRSRSGSGIRPRSCDSRASGRSRRAPTGRPTPARDDRLGRQRRGHDRDRGTTRRAGAAGARTPHPSRQRSAGAARLLDGKPVLLLCSNNYLGLADHPRVREAAAEAAMRWGVGAGASRLVSGTMTIHRRLEERLADVQGPPGGAAVRLRLPGEHRRDLGARAARRGGLLRRAQPRLDRRRLPPLARRGVRLRPQRRRAPRVGHARRRARAAR